MSGTHCSEGISQQDEAILRLFMITKSEFRQALHLVFKCGCKKEPDKSIKDYLTITKGMSNADYKKKFNSTMRETIVNDSTGETYDVSLLWICIRLGCDGLAQEDSVWRDGDEGLEGLCTTAKNCRNRLFHEHSTYDEAGLKALCLKFTELPEKIVKSAGKKYSIPDTDVEEIVKNIKERINTTMTTPLLDSTKLKSQMQKLREEQMNIINKQGKLELSERYTHISKIDPASFVTGRERLHVKNVFTKLEVICESKDKKYHETYDVQYNMLLDVKTEKGEQPAIIIVEGDAGAGKTTLTKLILSDWAEEKSLFEGIKDYDLILCGEGKHKHVTSYMELIQLLMPLASNKFADDNLVPSVLQLKVLLVMDGFDEINVGSEKLIRELSEIQIPKSSGKLQLLVTTRPSKLSDLLNVVQPHSVVQTKLMGISVNKRVEFVSKLHDEMIKEKQSIQETKKLIDLMKQSQSRLGEHYRLPLNLTLLTYLWASDPEKVNPETTATGLYVAFLELLQSRLLVRLQNRMGVHDLPKYKSEEDVRKFLQQLYRVCLDTLSSGFMQLSDASVEVLRNKSTELNLPFNDMTEAFLAVEKEWTITGYKTYLTVPHKSILEFYAANQFMTHINNLEDAPSDKAMVMSLLEKMNMPKEEREQILRMTDKYSTCDDSKSFKQMCKKLLKTDKGFNKYENMFLYLTGLLAHQCPNKLHEYSEELVDVMRDAGFQERKWLDALVEAKCDEKLADLLAPKYSGLLTIHDGHTGAALALFKKLETNTPVKIILENEVSYIPCLDDMLLQLAKRDCSVELFLLHQWKHQEYGFSDNCLNYLLQAGNEDQCKVTRLTGHLNTLSHLPESLERLCITFANTEHAQRLLKELHDLVEKNYIDYLGIHVMPDVQPEGLSPLPVLRIKNMECGNLWLSSVTDNWKTKYEVIRALLPPNGMFNCLMFPQSNVSVAQCEELINELSRHKVKVGETGGLKVSSSIINKKELIGLKRLARDKLRCGLYCLEESAIW